MAAHHPLSPFKPKKEAAFKAFPYSMFVKPAIVRIALALISNFFQFNSFGCVGGYAVWRVWDDDQQLAENIFKFLKIL